MSTKLFTITALLALTASAPGAQQAQTPTPKSDVMAQAAPSSPRQPAQLVNIKLELTITDQRGASAPTSKTVTLVMADRAAGRIRTQGEVRLPSGRGVPIILNVDAQPEITRDSRIKVFITLEYKPQAGEGDTEERATTSISESLTVILDDGKSLLVSQSADPSSDRKVKIEAKATLLK
ncbi:MAG TPA: hypothetical protein VNJ03_06745 [Vicinamibacterales bacterium]|nr:hypothetical protein [Vicinamibacterales bacterium]